MKLKVKTSRVFSIAPTPLLHKEQPVPFKSRGHLCIVKQKAFERGCRSLVPTQHRLPLVGKCHKPHLPRNTYHDTKVIVRALKGIYHSDLQLLLLQPRLPSLTSGDSVKWFHRGNCCCYVQTKFAFLLL